MLKQKCPQCGENLIIDNVKNTMHCTLCGWGGNGTPITSKSDRALNAFSAKPVRWKIATLSAVIIIGLLIPSGFSYALNELQANRAISKAKSQMEQRLYASAAKTLHQTPRNSVRTAKFKEVRVLLADNVRFARDIAGVGAAKESLVQSNPDAALDTMEEVDQDFPHEDEVVELIDLAQDQTLNPDLAVSEEVVDDIAYVPDDPEENIVDELDSDNDGQMDIAPDTGNNASPQATTASNPQTPQASTDSAQPQPPAEEFVEPDDGDPVDPEELADPPEDELPEVSDENSPPPTPEAIPPSVAGRSRQVNFYVMKWFDNPSNPTNQDHFFTIDLANEINPRRDRKSGFGGYIFEGVSAGLLYSRKVPNKKRIIPLYRYWSANRVDHFYTTKRNFSSNNPRANYVRQGVAGYIGKWSERQNRCLAGKTPLYNVYTP
jgi:hypothetical protein